MSFSGEVKEELGLADQLGAPLSDCGNGRFYQHVWKCYD